MVAEENRQMMVLEDGLRQGLQALGRMVLARTLSQADRELGCELPCQCGGDLQSARRGAPAQGG